MLIAMGVSFPATPEGLNVNSNECFISHNPVGVEVKSNECFISHNPVGAEVKSNECFISRNPALGLGRTGFVVGVCGCWGT